MEFFQRATRTFAQVRKKSPETHDRVRSQNDLDCGAKTTPSGHNPCLQLRYFSVASNLKGVSESDTASSGDKCRGLMEEKGGKFSKLEAKTVCGKSERTNHFSLTWQKIHTGQKIVNRFMKSGCGQALNYSQDKIWMTFFLKKRGNMFPEIKRSSLSQNYIFYMQEGF